MDYGIFDVLKLIGSLGVFLYGMKLMSESLQKLAGNKMRQILTAMTSNRVTGVLTGLFITALIQSSSATTVMVVSFVNAGRLYRCYFGSQCRHNHHQLVGCGVRTGKIQHERSGSSDYRLFTAPIVFTKTFPQNLG